jgi:hypothetical protein
MTDSVSDETPFPPSSIKKGRREKLVEILRRDVKTFWPKRQPDVSQEDVTQAPSYGSAPLDARVESLTNPAQLQFLAYQRMVLDWRDDAHARVVQTLEESHRALLDHIDEELKETGLFRKVVARSAKQVVEPGFFRLARMPLNEVLLREAARLAVHAERGALFEKIDLTFDMGLLNSECDDLRDIRFTQAKRALIVSRLQATLLGPDGLAAGFCKQITRLAGQLIDGKRAC